MKQATFSFLFFVILKHTLSASTFFSDAQENTIEIQYNDKNRPIEKIHANGLKESFQYDPEGNMVSASIQYPSPSSRIDGRKFDKEERLILSFSSLDSLVQQQTAFEYDEKGRQTARIKPDGNVVHTLYRDFNLPTEIYDTQGSLHSLYHYDSEGRMVHAQDLLNQTSTLRIFNQDNQVIEEQMAHGLKIHYEYDQDGNKTLMTLPDGSYIHYVYENNHVIAVQRLDQFKELKYEHLYENFDENGKSLSASMIGKCGKLEHTYDSLQRIQTVNTAHWSENIPPHSYDEKGNPRLITIRDPHGDQKIHYAYGPKHQLISEEGAFTHTYAFDIFDNLSEFDQASVLVNRLDQMIQKGDCRYSYDCNGNRIRMENRDGIVSYRYDPFDRLVQVEKNGEFRSEYTYDPLNRRISKHLWNWDSLNNSWVLQKELYYIYDGNQEIGAADRQGRLLELRVLGNGYGAEIGSAVAFEFEDQVFAPVHDHRGNCVALLDAESGDCVEFVRYSSFGEEQIYQMQALTFQNPWRFSSKRIDEETGFVFYGKRLYDPSTCRWLSLDPLGAADGFNRYVFLKNNPVTNLDPFGLFSISETFWNLVKTSKPYYDTFQQYVESWQQEIQNNFSFTHFLKNDIEELNLYLFGKRFLQFSGFYTSPPLSGLYGSKELDPLVKITFVNGILNLKEDIMENARFISATHGGNKVYYVFRPTEGWTFDLFSCALVKLGFVSQTAELIAATWRKLIEDMGGIESGGKIIHYAHSIGGTDTYTAKTLLTPEERKMIHVITLGSATMIPDLDFASVTNYVSMRDGVSYLDPLGFFGGFFDDESNIIYLGSLHGIPVIDHLLVMQTYIEVMKLLGEQFLEIYINREPLTN